MSLQSLLEKIRTQPQAVEFSEVIAAIDANYDYTPSRFSNGSQINEAGSNEGSCKIFAFAQLNQLTEEQTLACFGNFYRDDVLQNPQGTDHANIRNFMASGWGGITFDSAPLAARAH